MERRCPVCQRSVRHEPAKPLPRFFPFCSERCRMVDLGKWLMGDYTISRPLTPAEKGGEMERRESLREEGREED